MKSIYLKRNKLFRTDQVKADETLASVQHDIPQLMKLLKLPRSFGAGISCFRLRKDEKEHYPLGEAHQSWRYGVDIKAEDETAIVKWLQNLHRWVEENPS